MGDASCIGCNDYAARNVAVSNSGMMETACLFALAGCHAGYCRMWRLHWLPDSLGRRVRVFSQAIAIVCALALLFPSISLTDDLHPEIVAVDSSSGKRNSGHLLASRSHIQRVTDRFAGHSPVAVFSPSFAHVEPSAAGHVFFAKCPHASSRSSDYSGRSPPSPATLGW